MTVKNPFGGFNISPKVGSPKISGINVVIENLPITTKTIDGNTDGKTTQELMDILVEGITASTVQ